MMRGRGIPKANEVFISYSRRNKEFALALQQQLRMTGIDAWLDTEDIPKSAEWWRAIRQGIDGANVFLCVISPDSLTSEMCNWEVAHAIKRHKKIVPLLFRDRTALLFLEVQRIVMEDSSTILIRTKEKALSQQDYYHIWLKYGYPRWLMRACLGWIIAFVLSNLFLEKAHSWYFICVAIGLVLLPFFMIRHYVRSPENRTIFVARRYEIDDMSITSYLKTGDLSKHSLDSFVKVGKTPEGFWLHLTQLNYLFLPFDIFFTQEDIVQFEEILKRANLTIKVRGNRRFLGWPFRS